MAPQDSLETNHLAADIVFRAGTLSLLPTPRFDKQSPEVVRIRVRPEREITEVDPGVDLPIETRPRPEPPKVTRLRKKRAARRKPPELPPVVAALQRARDYQRRIATGEAKDRADLARQLGFSRARVMIAHWPSPAMADQNRSGLRSGQTGVWPYLWLITPI